jgi:hypothetical protein
MLAMAGGSETVNSALLHKSNYKRLASCLLKGVQDNSKTTGCEETGNAQGVNHPNGNCVTSKQL